MKVCNLVEAYIAYRRSLGEKYQSPAVILRSFARYIGEDKECMSIDEKICTAFLYSPNSSDNLPHPNIEHFCRHYIKVCQHVQWRNSQHFQTLSSGQQYILFR